MANSYVICACTRQMCYWMHGKFTGMHGKITGMRGKFTGMHGCREGAHYTRTLSCTAQTVGL